MTITPEVRHALVKGRDQVWSRHGKDPNFTGCGIGYRRRGGKVTGEPVVIAMVVDKLPSGALSSRRLIPASVKVDGTVYGVDVVEVGRVYASGQGTTSPRSTTTSGPVLGTFRPLQMGCGISNADVFENRTDPTQPLYSPAPAGTLGCFVQNQANGNVYLVSAGHVLATGPNEWAPGQPGNIAQPALADQGPLGSVYTGPVVATIDMISELDTTPGSMMNTADVGTALLSVGNDWSLSVAEGLMPPISANHPAVGMVVASTPGGNTFLTQMNNTINAIGLMLLGAANLTDFITIPQVGMYLEKVGRSSGYTSSIVDATDVIVTVQYLDPVHDTLVPITLSDMIWSQYLSLIGDSGSVACQGGDGQTYCTPPRAPCALLQQVQTYYGLPATTSDNNLTNNFQSKCLTQTVTGNLLIGLVYMNQQQIVERLSAATGPAYNQAAAQAFFQQFYATYRPVIVSMLTGPASFVLTPQMGTDLINAFNMIYQTPANGGQGLLSFPEANIISAAVMYVYIWSNEGYTYDQVQNYLAQAKTYDSWYAELTHAPTIVAP